MRQQYKLRHYYHKYDIIINIKDINQFLPVMPTTKPNFSRKTATTSRLSLGNTWAKPSESQIN